VKAEKAGTSASQADVNPSKEAGKMPLASIKVIEGVFSPQEKQQMIEAVTDALVAIEGEGLRDKTVVIVEETKSGDWGVGGQVLTTEDVQRLRSPHTATR